MRKLAVLGLSLSLLAQLPAQAAPEIFKTTVDGAQRLIVFDAGAEGTEINLSYAGLGQRVAVTNACGVTTFNFGSNVPASASIGSTSINVSTLPVVTAPTCDAATGTLSAPLTANSKTSDGKVLIPGGTANTAVTINFPRVRKAKANACGFAVVRPNATYLHGSSQVVSGLVGTTAITGGAISSITAKDAAPICRKNSAGVGTTYVPTTW